MDSVGVYLFLMLASEGRPGCLECVLMSSQTMVSHAWATAAVVCSACLQGCCGVVWCGAVEGISGVLQYCFIFCFYDLLKRCNQWVPWFLWLCTNRHPLDVLYVTMPRRRPGGAVPCRAVLCCAVRGLGISTSASGHVISHEDLCNQQCLLGVRNLFLSSVMSCLYLDPKDS